MIGVWWRTIHRGAGSQAQTFPKSSARSSPKPSAHVPQTPCNSRSRRKAAQGTPHKPHTHARTCTTRKNTHSRVGMRHNNKPHKPLNTSAATRRVRFLKCASTSTTCGMRRQARVHRQKKQHVQGWSTPARRDPARRGGLLTRTGTWQRNHRSSHQG